MVAAGRVPDEYPEPPVEAGAPRSLIDLGLRGPTLGVLQRQGILSVEQLVNMTPEELMGMRRVGLSRMLEVRQALQARGLDLVSDDSALATAVRIWGTSRRVRLLCCDRGDCVLDFRTAGGAADELARVSAAFVAAHRSCPYLEGREPVVSSTDATRPLSFGGGARRQSTPAATVSRLGDDQQSA